MQSSPSCIIVIDYTYHHHYHHQSMWLESPITFLHCVHEARMKKIVHLPPPSEKQIYIVQVIMMVMMMRMMADPFAFLLGGIVPFKTILIALSSYHNQALWGLRLSFILKCMPWFEINIICYFFSLQTKMAIHDIVATTYYLENYDRSKINLEVMIIPSKVW